MMVGLNPELCKGYAIAIKRLAKKEIVRLPII
jgi:hypothetical protein